MNQYGREMASSSVLRSLVVRLLAMSRNRMTVRALVASVLLVRCAGAFAGDPYELTWHTIDSGGGTSAGGNFSLSGTIGQHDAGTMSGGVFVLSGGFWAGSGAPQTPTCPADLTGDGTVGVPDLLVLLGAWGANPGHPADLTGNGNVGVPDLLALLGAWGPCP